MKVADISNEARPMQVADPWIDCLLMEFFNQVWVRLARSSYLWLFPLNAIFCYVGCELFLVMLEWYFSQVRLVTTTTFMFHPLHCNYAEPQTKRKYFNTSFHMPRSNDLVKRLSTQHDVVSQLHWKCCARSSPVSSRSVRCMCRWNFRG